MGPPQLPSPGCRPLPCGPVSVGRAALQEPVSGATPAGIDDPAMLTVGWGPWEDEKKCGCPLQCGCSRKHQTRRTFVHPQNRGHNSLPRAELRDVCFLVTSGRNSSSWEILGALATWRAGDSR